MAVSVRKNSRQFLSPLSRPHIFLQVHPTMASAIVSPFRKRLLCEFLRRYSPALQRIPERVTDVTFIFPERRTSLLRATFSSAPCSNLEDLTSQTQTMIDRIRRMDSKLSVNECFDYLEYWMEQSMSNPEAPAMAHSLLQALEDNFEQDLPTTLVPRISFYEVVLKAYAVSQGGRPAAQAATDLIRHMRRRSRRPNPSTKAINIAIDCWANTRDKDAGFRAEELMRLADEKLPGTFAMVLHAWANSRHVMAPERSLELLREILQHPTHDTEEDELMTHVFNTAMKTWVQSGRGREAAETVEGLLRQMVESNVIPSTVTYSTVVDAWTQCEKLEQKGRAVQRAEKILDNMIRHYSSGLAAVKPNTITFTSCIVAYSHCRNLPEAPERAEKLLQQLYDLYKETQDEDFRPDVSIVNAVVHVWTRSSRDDAVEKAQAILEEAKEHCEPNIISYNTLLNVMARKGDSARVDQMIQMLETESQGGKTHLRPNRITYNSLLTAIVKDPSNRSAEQAESILRRMHELHAQGRADMRPDTISYSTVIDAWSRASKGSDAMKRCLALIEEMKGLHEKGVPNVKPDAICYSNLIKTCHNTTDKSQEDHCEQAIQVILDAVHTLQKDGPPNHVAYMFALNALAALSSPRDARLRPVVQACLNGGYLSSRIFLFCQKHWGLRLEQVRPEWSRRVPPKERP